MLGIIILTGTAFVLSIILVLVDTKLVLKNRALDDLIELLPKINCGACGYGSCEGMANAIIEDKENYKKCKILRKDALTKMEEYISKMK